MTAQTVDPPVDEAVDQQDLPEEPEPQALIITTADLNPPDGRKFWLDDSMFALDDDGMHVPRFSVQEAAKCFFGQSADWLRWRMRGPIRGRNNQAEKYFTLDGELLEFKRLKGESKSETARYYTLADIEKMGHALAQNGAISGVDLAHIVVMVRACARLYGIEEPGQPEAEAE